MLPQNTQKNVSLLACVSSFLYSRPHLFDPIFKCLLCQAARPLNSFPIIIWAPAGTIDIHMIWIEPNGTGFDGIGDYSIQHSYALILEVEREWQKSVITLGQLFICIIRHHL